MKYKIKAGVTSRKGKYRALNEDNYLFGSKFLSNGDQDSDLSGKFGIPVTFAVFDGMGGSGYGKDASLTAADTLYQSSGHLDRLKQEELPQAMEEWISLMNHRVYTLTEQGKKTGCTLAMGCLHERGIFLANVGDSRIYRFFDNKLEQLSVDHNQAQDLLSFGLGTDKNTKKSVLTQFIGMPPEEVILEPCYKALEYDNMLLLLCSDGLDAELSNEDMTKIITEHRKSNPKKLTQLLVDEAMKKGSRDNITAMMIKIYS